MIRKRLNLLSKNEDAFNSQKDPYEEALRKSGYRDSRMVYEKPPSQGKTGKRNRRKPSIFYNAPFCLSVKTNIGKEFFKIVDKHFNKDHQYYKILNRNTIKLSYSCMNNVRAIIQSHNKRTLARKDTPANQPSRSCNCTKKDQCPLNGKCLTENLIYKATVSSSSGMMEYLGSTGQTFKKRYYGHKSSITRREKRLETKLSDYVWKIKDNNETPHIDWSIVHAIGPKSNTLQRTCSTCNLERIAIANAEKKRSLNKRSELTGSCPHFRGLYFKTFKNNKNEKNGSTPIT